MANLISYSDFDGLIFLDTSNEDSQVKITKIIEQVEAEILPLLTFATGDVKIKTMLTYFVFALYNSKLKSINTAVGNVELLTNGANIVIDNESYHYYNEAVDLFNSYVTLDENLMWHQNRYGI